MTKNIIKGWKTTTIGLILFIVGIAYIFINASPDYILVSILLATAIMFLFAPDDLLEQLKNLTKNKAK